MPHVIHRLPDTVSAQLKAAADDDAIISLAGALPADELFPFESMKAALERVMRSDAAVALQYGWPEGKDKLLRHVGNDAIVTNGAQEALHLVGHILVDEGALLAVEVPTYASALQSFDLRRPRYVAVRRTTKGLDLGALEESFRGGARVFYLVASGHDPTGGVLDVAALEAILSLAEKWGVWIIDDRAYADIVYGERPPSLRSFGRHLDHIVEIGSFSKVLAPGLRVGWLAGPDKLVRDATILKSAVDLETSAFTQLVLASFLESSPLESHVARCLPVYQRRRDALVRALEHEMPLEVSWSRPEGGFSALLTAPIEALTLVPLAIEAGILIEPAAPYYASTLVPGAIRLSFSNVSEERIADGVRRLGRVLRDVLPGRSRSLQASMERRKT